MMSVVKPHDPIVEAMARKLSGLEICPPVERKRMVSRSVKIVAEKVGELREENSRLRAALEQIDALAKLKAEIGAHEHDLLAANSWEQIRAMCEEALK